MLNTKFAFRSAPRHVPAFLSLVLTLFLFTSGKTVVVVAQSDFAQSDDRARASQLFEKGKYADALPLLEKLVAANPEDGGLHAQTGFAAFATAKTTNDEKEQRRLRLKARTMLLKAKELGTTNELIEGILASIPADGSDDGSKFSENKEADRVMREAEAVFSRGDMDGARKLYEKALSLDPKLYFAALFAGDMYFKMGYGEKDSAKKTQLLDQSGVWFARAIAIDPNIETAHRYWGTALMAQGKMDAARDKVVEAYVTNPYAQLSSQGLLKWANMMGVRAGHPKIEIPVSVTSKGNGNIGITLDEKGADPNKNDGSVAWTIYGLSRAAYQGDKFSKDFPKEKTYRHTLREEAEALRAVVKFVQEQQQGGKIKTLAPALATLVKLEKDGLLEAYILLARVDQGIAQDYLEYRRTSPDKLRRYVVEYTLSPSN